MITARDTSEQSTQTDLNNLTHLMDTAKKSLSISMLLDLAFFSALGFPQETLENLQSRSKSNRRATSSMGMNPTNVYDAQPKLNTKLGFLGPKDETNSFRSEMNLNSNLTNDINSNYSNYLKKPSNYSPYMIDYKFNSNPVSLQEEKQAASTKSVYSNSTTSGPTHYDSKALNDNLAEKTSIILFDSAQATVKNPLYPSQASTDSNSKPHNSLSFIYDYKSTKAENQTVSALETTYPEAKTSTSNSLYSSHNASDRDVKSASVDSKIIYSNTAIFAPKGDEATNNSKSYYSNSIQVETKTPVSNESKENSSIKLHFSGTDHDINTALYSNSLKKETSGYKIAKQKSISMQSLVFKDKHSKEPDARSVVSEPKDFKSHQEAKSSSKPVDMRSDQKKMTVKVLNMNLAIVEPEKPRSSHYSYASNKTHQAEHKKHRKSAIYETTERDYFSFDSFTLENLNKLGFPINQQYKTFLNLNESPPERSHREREREIRRGKSTAPILRDRSKAGGSVQNSDIVKKVRFNIVS